MQVRNIAVESLAGIGASVAIFPVVPEFRGTEPLGNSRAFEAVRYSLSEMAELQLRFGDFFCLSSTGTPFQEYFAIVTNKKTEISQSVAKFRMTAPRNITTRLIDLEFAPRQRKPKRICNP